LADALQTSTSQSSFARDSKDTPPLTGSTGSIRRKSSVAPITISEGLTDRINIEEGESLQFSFTLQNLRPGEQIQVCAPHGGDLFRPNAAPLVFSPASSSEKLVLDFKPSIGPGAYTISVTHGGETFIVDLWAGPINPLGQPGEKYIPSASTH
jgi:hypothetical protein